MCTKCFRQLLGHGVKLSFLQVIQRNGTLAAALCPRCDPPGVTREGPTAVQSADVNTLLHTASGEKGMGSVKGEFGRTSD